MARSPMGGCRIGVGFIPIPFIDDIVRTQCRPFVVSRTLESAGRETPPTDLKPFSVSQLFAEFDLRFNEAYSRMT